MRLGAATRGSQPLALGDAADYGRERDRIVMDRGAVRVRYDLTPEGVEQSFAFDATPGSGELTLIVDVETELAIEERGRGFRFSNERGGVDYGGAVAFDADGAQTDVSSSWTEPGSSTTAIEGVLATSPSAPAAGLQYCYGTVNITGDRGFLQAGGNLRVTSPQSLRVEALPPNAFGYYLSSLATGNVPGAGGSQGTPCLGGSVGRFGLFQADASGTAVGVLNPQQIAQPLGPVAAVAGERWHVQSWHRDAVNGVPTSNFTNGIAIPFR